MKIAALILLTTALVGSAHAAVTVNVVAGTDLSGRYLTPTGNSINTDYRLEWGIFDLSTYNGLSPTEQTDFATVSPLLSSNQTLTPDASGDIISSTSPGNQFDLPLAGGGTTGDKLYIIVYNSLNTNEWGLFSSSLTTWNVPADNFGLAVLTTTSIDNVLVGSKDGVNALLANTVPEPSTYALLAGLMTLGLVAYRRRQKA